MDITTGELTKDSHGKEIKVHNEVMSGLIASATASQFSFEQQMSTSLNDYDLEGNQHLIKEELMRWE